jgi:hypothetical protein
MSHGAGGLVTIPTHVVDVLRMSFDQGVLGAVTSCASSQGWKNPHYPS